MSSSIVIRAKYKHSLKMNDNISKWIKYVSKKEKADSGSLDEKNYLLEYYDLVNKDSFFDERSESFVWDEKGDVNPKLDLSKYSNNGFVWKFVLSFPPEFAINNGLITKSDYFDLSKQIMPKLIMDMNLKLYNTCWYASLHRNTDNPHLHIILFEKTKTISRGLVPKYALYNMKSNIANYLIDNKEFYELRDREFSSITGGVSLKELTKVKNQKLYSDDFRRTLNKKMLSFYEIIPKQGRLQYNSKNMSIYKKELNKIIEFILSHDSVKYNYANYLRLLEEHQRELTAIYGNTKDNINRKYYNAQLNKLYSKIGNEILSNYKIYQSMDLMEREKSFLKKHINEMQFKSRSDYAKVETKENIAKGLYKICLMADLNDNEIKKVFARWLKKSKYDFDLESIIIKSSTLEYEMSSTEYYETLKRLGYDYDRFKKLKNKSFYKELNYKRFVNKAFDHLIYELEQERKNIISDMQYDLEVI